MSRLERFYIAVILMGIALFVWGMLPFLQGQTTIKGGMVGTATQRPGTCSSGDIYIETDAGSGQRIRVCSATNTWDQVAAFGAIPAAYNGVPLVSNGLHGTVAQLNSTAKGADQAAATVFATGTTPGAGQYLVTMVSTVTRAATTSSTLPTGCIKWTDQDNTGTTQNLNVTGSAVGNLLSTFGQGVTVVNAAANSNIQYATGLNCTGGVTFASVGGTSMQYSVRVRVTPL